MRKLRHRDSVTCLRWQSQDLDLHGLQDLCSYALHLTTSWCIISDWFVWAVVIDVLLFRIYAPDWGAATRPLYITHGDLLHGPPAGVPTHQLGGGKRKTLMRSVCQCPWCKGAHPAIFQAASMKSLDEEVVGSSTQLPARGLPCWGQASRAWSSRRQEETRQALASSLVICWWGVEAESVWWPSGGTSPVDKRGWIPRLTAIILNGILLVASC